MSKLSNLWAHLTGWLFPALAEELDPLTEKHQQFVTVCELAQLDKHMAAYRGHRLGRRKQPRLDFAKAFVAKAVYDVPTTKAMVERLKFDKTLLRLCGWEFAEKLPDESTFSRAFAELAKGELGSVVHAAMIQEHCSEKLVGHISRDSTAIAAREKAAKREKKEETPKPKHKRGRPKKGETREAPEPKRLELQPGRSLQENLADLPKGCDWGCKKNSQGKREWWKGYKAHVDCSDSGIPISVIVTSASPHDSQAAIALSQMSSQRVENLYDLMDAAYDAKEIWEFSRSLGHVPIIDRNGHGQEKLPMDPATARRYDERTVVERFNADLKDNHGGRHVRVRGHLKVQLHLMFGVIAITGLQLIRLLE